MAVQNSFALVSLGRREERTASGIRPYTWRHTAQEYEPDRPSMIMDIFSLASVIFHVLGALVHESLPSPLSELAIWALQPQSQVPNERARLSPLISIAADVKFAERDN